MFRGSKNHLKLAELCRQPAMRKWTSLSEKATWSYNDVCGFADNLFALLPHQLRSELSDRRLERQLIVLPGTRKVRATDCTTNFEVIFAVLCHLPERIPSVYLLADVMAMLDRRHFQCKLVKRIPGKSYNEVVLVLSSKWKKLVQHTRRIKRKNAGAKTKHLQILKGLVAYREKHDEETPAMCKGEQRSVARWVHQGMQASFAAVTSRLIASRQDDSAKATAFAAGVQLSTSTPLTCITRFQQPQG